MLLRTGTTQKGQRRARGADQSREKGGLGCLARKLILAVCGRYFCDGRRGHIFTIGKYNLT